MERDTSSQTMDAEKPELEAWLGFRNFMIWPMNFRSEISSCASRPNE